MITESIETECWNYQYQVAKKMISLTMYKAQGTKWLRIEPMRLKSLGAPFASENT